MQNSTIDVDGLAGGLYPVVITTTEKIRRMELAVMREIGTMKNHQTTAAFTKSGCSIFVQGRTPK